MNNPLFNKILPHVGHDIEAITYGDNETVWNLAIECLTCQCVIVDADSESEE